VRKGGTAAAPPELNDRNRWEPANAWPDAAHCAFFVGLRGASEPPLQGAARPACVPPAQQGWRKRRDAAASLLQTDAAASAHRPHAPSRASTFGLCLGPARIVGGLCSGQPACKAQLVYRAHVA